MNRCLWLLVLALSATARAQTVHLSDPGPDPSDSTEVLQRALHSGASTVIVAKLSAPWLTGPLFLTNSLTVVFAPGAELMAREGAFHGRTDALLTVAGARNIRLLGSGATLRMRRTDYAGTNYTKAEWRHALSLRGASNVTVEGLTLAESGGDGIYVSTGPTGEPCRDVTIRGVRCDRNYRQGISVISADRLLIEDCILRDTGGTAPAAGIDFEPNRPAEQLTDCVLRRCTIENNQGLGLHLALHQLTGASKPVSVRIEDCVLRGTNARSASVHTLNGGTNGAPRGTIYFLRCRFEETTRPGLIVGSKPADGIAVTLDQCVIDLRQTTTTNHAAVLFQSRPRDRAAMGGLQFRQCRALGDSALLRFDDLAGVALKDVRGDVAVERGRGQETIRIDAATLARLVPQDPVLKLPFMAPEDVHLVAVGAAGVPRNLTPFRIRGSAHWLVAMKTGDEARLRLRHRTVGSAPASDAAVRIAPPSGPYVVDRLPVGQEKEFTIAAAKDGLAELTCDPATHSVALLSSTHPVACAAEGPVRFIGSTGDLFFVCPAGVADIGLRVAGQGDGERVGAELFDAAGVSRWKEADIGWARSHTITRRPDAPAESWRLRIAPPAQGHFEDFSIELRGAPTLLNLAPDFGLRSEAPR